MKALRTFTLVILALTISSCSHVKSVKIIAEDTIKDDVISLVEADVHQLQSIDHFVVQSEIQDGKTITVITTFEFTTDFATVSATMSLTYNKNDEVWIIDKKKMTIDSIEVFEEASLEEANAIIKADPVPLFVLSSWHLFNESKLSLINKEQPSTSETIFKFHYADQQLNWSLDQFYIVKATFDYRSGWSYQLSDWSYTETSDWNGKWKIEWYVLGGPSVEVYKDIVITGKLTVTNNLAGIRTVSDPLQVSFTLDGKSYQASGIVSPNEGITRRVRVTYGTYSSDWFELILNIAGPIAGSGNATYGADCNLYDYYSGGSLTKID